MSLLVEILASLLLVLGAGFALVGAIGLVKLDNPMSRLHAPTKASTLGVGSLLMGSMLAALHRGDPSVSEILILGFLFLTAPVIGHFLAKSNIHHRRDIETLPDAPQDETWGVLMATDVAQRDEPIMPDRERPATPAEHEAAAGG